jgi:hypothetical protein
MDFGGAIARPTGEWTDMYRTVRLDGNQTVTNEM